MTTENQFIGMDGLLFPALEQAIDAVVLIDENNNIIFFNRAAEQLWGYSRTEMLGRNVKYLVPRAIQSVHDGYIADNRITGVNKIVGTSREVMIERKDDRQIWVTFSLSKVDVAGRIYYMAFVRDVSGEVARREENRLLLLAINNTDRAMFVLNDERRIVQTNRAFTALFGYDAAEVIGKVPTEFLASPDTGKEALVRLRSKAWDTLSFQEEILAACKDGRDIWVKASINPIFDETVAGRVRNLVVVLSDVTEERQIRDLERDVLEALTSDLSFAELGNFLCRSIELIEPSVLVSICRVAEGKLRPWAAPSFHASYGPDWEGVEIGEGVAGCGTCAHRGEPVMVYDIETDPLWAPYKHQMLPHGYKACWTYPVKQRDGSVVGTFAFYFRQGSRSDLYMERIADASVHLCALAIEREDNRQKMIRLVQFDNLTGLPNRSNLHRYIDDLLSTAPKQDIAFFDLDLDHFKDINDTLGHMAGDQVLLEMANRLKNNLQPNAFLSRTEADLFVIVVPNCDVRRASLLAESFLATISAQIEIGGHLFNLSASVGVSHYPIGGRDRDVLLANAKNAMYQAKKSGGGSYQFFAPEMNLMARDRLLLGTALKRAIAQGGLRLQYQPQVHPDNGRLYGVEALARWHDAELGDIPPGKFISLAEEIGEIEAIGRWALREACRQMAAWRKAGVQVPVVSVNLSPFNFRSRDLLEYVADLLREYELPGDSLTIEITESTMMALTPEMLEILHVFREMGIGLSVDDFGTGFSSLSNLANLPVTEVKIDRSFIDKCLQESRLQSLVMAVIGIGRSLNLMVVAEGVETEEQCELLKAHHCPVIQGYLFSRPLEPRDFLNWITTRINTSHPETK